MRGRSSQANRDALSLSEERSVRKSRYPLVGMGIEAQVKPGFPTGCPSAFQEMRRIRTPRP